MSTIKDKLIEILSEKTLSELEGNENEGLIKLEILEETNKILSGKKEIPFNSVYFEEFVVQ